MHASHPKHKAGNIVKWRGEKKPELRKAGGIGNTAKHTTTVPSGEQMDTSGPSHHFLHISLTTVPILLMPYFSTSTAQPFRKIPLALHTALPYIHIMQVVIETPDYLADAKTLGLTEDERRSIVDYVAQNPDAGDEMKGTGGARKIRFAGRGKGKSGGYRVVTFFSGKDIPVFLLSIFSKGEKANLSPSERNELKEVLGSIAEAYREGVKRHVKGRK